MSKFIKYNLNDLYEMSSSISSSKEQTGHDSHYFLSDE